MKNEIIIKENKNCDVTDMSVISDIPQVISECCHVQWPMTWRLQKIPLYIHISGISKGIHRSMKYGIIMDGYVWSPDAVTAPCKPSKH